MVSRLYSTKEASALAGASRQIIRTYTDRYKEHFSREVQAQPGQPRRFTADDLKLIAYIYQQTSQQSQTHEQIQAALAAGALEQFDWQPPEAQESVGSSEVPPSTALVPVERLQAAQALMLDAQRREEEAREQAKALQDRLAALERELGKAQGELSAYKAMQRKPPAWWAKLFGGRQDN
jgi:DNA-binding transcriptional MerR regulator